MIILTCDGHTYLELDRVGVNLLPSLQVHVLTSLGPLPAALTSSLCDSLPAVFGTSMCERVH